VREGGEGNSQLFLKGKEKPAPDKRKKPEKKRKKRSYECPTRRGGKRRPSVLGKGEH